MKEFSKNQLVVSVNTNGTLKLGFLYDPKLEIFFNRKWSYLSKIIYKKR